MMIAWTPLLTIARDFIGEALYAATLIAEEQHTVPGSEGDAPRRIFNNPRGTGYSSRSIEFSKRQIRGPNGPLHGIPLASGSIVFRHQDEDVPLPDFRRMQLEREGNPQDFRPTLFRIEAHLDLNPTRMINHQNLREAALSRDEPGFTYPDIQLLTSRRGVADDRTGGEFTLANHDNVIVNVSGHIMSQPPHYRHLRDRYFHDWFAFIDERVTGRLTDQMTVGEPVDTARDYNGRLTREPRFSLHYVESYHEFRCDNPLQAIENLRPHIRGLSQQVRNMRITDRTHADFISGNELGYRVDLAPGLEMVVYAKTNRRIRIEARTRLSERCDDRQFPHTRYTANTLEEILTLIDATAEDAARYVNRALRWLRPGLPTTDDAPEEQHEHPYELVREIMRAVNDEHRDFADNVHNRRAIASAQRLLISLILIRNSCAPLPNSRLAAAVRRLQRRGVLEPPESGVRRLALKYQNARRVLLAELHGQASGPETERD